MLPPDCQKLPVSSDFGECALEHALDLLGFKPLITVYVGQDQYQWAKQCLKSFNTESQKNPGAPYLNLVVDTMLTEYAWYVVYNGKTVGSPGAGG